jgi:hypothetical protein
MQCNIARAGFVPAGLLPDLMVVVQDLGLMATLTEAFEWKRDAVLGWRSSDVTMSSIAIAMGRTTTLLRSTQVRGKSQDESIVSPLRMTLPGGARRSTASNAFISRTGCLVQCAWS